MGAFGIACYYAPFAFMVGNAIAQSAQPIISYNFGIGDSERVRKTGRVALLTALLCGTVSAAAFILFPRLLVGLFLQPDAAAARIAVEGLPLFATGFVFFISNLTIIGYNQSLERVVPATAFALLRGFVFLSPAFLLLPEAIGTAGIWLAMPASELLLSLIHISEPTRL